MSNALSVSEPHRLRTSVLITTYNRPDTLKKVLEALCRQTQPADEIIVADDGSGPETQDMIRHVEKDYRRTIDHVWQKDRGFRAARIRNRAVKRSTGEYIILLDGDCIPSCRFVQDHLTLAERKTFLQGKRILVGKEISDRFTVAHTKSSLKLIRHALSGKLSNSHHLIRLPRFPAFRNRSLSGIRSCNMSFFREDIFAVNGFNEDFTGWGREDSELAVRLYRYGLKRKSHPFMAICFHLWHEPNSTDNLKANDAILEDSVRSREYCCKNGLEKL